MAGKLLFLPIADIEIGERIAVRDDAHIAHLAGLFKADGQRDPIEVAKRGPDAARPWLLVAGYHRIHAAMVAGLSHIAAYQVADEHATVAQLKLIELSENVDHRKHRPIDLSILIAARAEIELAVDYPDASNEPWYVRAAQARWSKGGNAGDTMSPASEGASSDAAAIVAAASDWQGRTASAFGMAVRTLRGYLTIYRGLVTEFPDHISALNFHPALEGFTSAYRLAKIANMHDRRAVVELLVANAEVETLDQAMADAKVSTSKGGRMPEKDRPHSAFITHWQEMRIADRRVEADALADEVTEDIAKRMIAVFRKRGFI